MYCIILDNNIVLFYNYICVFVCDLYILFDKCYLVGIYIFSFLDVCMFFGGFM